MSSHNALLSIEFQDVYSTLLRWLLASPVELNERTGHRVRVGFGGTAFRLYLGDGILPTCGLRRLFPKSAAAEVAWFLSGSRDVTWLRKYAPIWDKFVEADGTTIKSGYGYRWRRHFDRDQIGLAVDALHGNPSDRRVFVSAWDPSEDGLGAIGQRNVPCPVGFSLSISDGSLHSSVMLRSSDVFVGLPYDVMGHALLMDAIAAELRLRGLGVALGVMHVTLAHAHLYEDHWDMANEALLQRPVSPEFKLPCWPVSSIEAAPDAYVDVVREESGRHVWPAFSPKPFVVE